MLRGPPLGAVQSREMCPWGVLVYVTALKEVDARTQLATGVAFHGLGLAIPCEVVGSAALVAGGRAGSASEATSEGSRSAESTANGRSSTSHSSHSCLTRVGAVAGQMAGKAAAIASSAGASSAQTQSGAVRLNVSETLAVVALLRCYTISMTVAAIHHLYHASHNAPISITRQSP